MARVQKVRYKGTSYYRSDFIDATGKRIRRKIAFSKAEALETQAQMIEQELQKKYLGSAPLEEISFVCLCEKFLEAKIKEGISKKYIRRLKLSIRHLKEAFGEMAAVKINHVLIGRYKNQRVRMVAAATVNRELACLSHMYNKAVEWGYARENPARQVRKFPEHYNQDRSLPPAQLKALLDACPEYLKWIVVFALSTALRLSEILTLKWPMLDDGLMVRDRKWRVSLSAPLGELAKAVLSKIPRYPGCEYVFPDEHGQPFVKYVDGEIFVRRIFHWNWERAVKQAGLNKFRFHDLRHTAGSWMAKLGCNSFQIQRIMGLKSIRTAERYVHLNGNDLVEPTNRLSGYVAGLVTRNLTDGSKMDNLLEVAASVSGPDMATVGETESAENPEKHGKRMAKTVGGN